MKPQLVLAHSHYSLGFGTASVEELAQWAARQEIPSLALTDIETLAGQMRFHDACAAAGVAPVTGVELRAGFSRRSVGRADGRLILLARDRAGYSNLCRTVGRRRQRGETGDPIEALEESEGLFLLTDEAELLERLLALDGIDRGNLGLLRPEGQGVEPPNGVRLAAIPEVAVLAEEDVAVHRLLLAIRHGITVGEVRQAGLDSETAGRRAAGDPRGLEEAGKIAEECTLDLRAIERIQPRLPELPSEVAPDELRTRCRSALGSLELPAGRARSEYDTRLGRELDTIEELGFVDYFLAVAEVVRGARELGTETAGRGSAAGSLVAYLLGITRIDPVAADLLFERFLHEQRDAPPDIDLDVASTGREDLNAWVVRRFGRERVAGVAAYSTYRARSAVRAGLGALGIARNKVDQVTRRLAREQDDEESEGELVERVLLQSLGPAVRQAAPLVRRLLGIPSHLSAHPGGIVIGDRPLAELVPLERAPGGTVVTQYDYRAVERAGFLKIDLLGNHFLSEMQEALAALADDVKIPEDDARSWETLDRADTVGCFQVESPPVRSVLRRLPMKEFDDLVAALAVVRPGAAAGASKERYIRRARGEERFEPLEFLGSDVDEDRFKGLHERLRHTCGVLLYDEDIIRLLGTVGGMSLVSADALRTSIIDAGEDSRALGRLGRQFVEGAVRAGTKKRVAERAWQAAGRFASYSFAEAHAASYADLAWKAVWLRTHAPREFGAALLNHHRALYPLRTTAAAVQRWGVNLLPPSVNDSRLVSAVVDEGVRIGLNAIKRLSRRTAEHIIGGRPFADLGQLLDAAHPSKRELRSLLLSGACDELPPLSPAGYPLVHEVVLEGVAGEAPPGALSDALRRVENHPEEDPEAQEFGRYQLLVRVRNEIEILGMHVTEHPMRLLRSEARSLGCLPSNELGSRVDQPVRFAGILAAARRVPTGEDELRYLTWEDEAGLVEGVLLPRANERLGERLTTPGPYLVEGMMRETDGDLDLVVTELRPFHER